MSKLRKQIIERDRNRELEMAVDFVVDLNADGWFTTTLKPEDAATIESYGITLKANRAGRRGYFKDETLAGLMEQIRKILNMCLEYKVTEEKVVLKYAFETRCDYCLNAETGDIAPNGSRKWTKSNDYEWKSGGEEKNPFYSKSGFGVNLWCKPFTKKTIEYGNGTTKTLYVPYQETEDVTDLNFLAALPGKNALGYGKLHEIDATEDNARFFVKIIKSICKMNEQIGDILKEGKIDLIINKMLMLE